MSFQTIRLASRQAQTLGEEIQTNDDKRHRGVDRGYLVTYPVPIAIRVLWWMWVIGTAGIIVMLVLGGMR